RGDQLGRGARAARDRLARRHRCRANAGLGDEVSRGPRSRRPSRFQLGGDRVGLDAEPEARLAMADLATVAATFGDRLHSAGIPVTPERSGRFAAVLDLTAPATYADVYWAARITLISGYDQLEQFDRVFGHIFGELADQAGPRGDPGSPPTDKPRSRSAESSENRRGTAGSGRSGEAHRDD